MNATNTNGRAAYEAPQLVEIGAFYEQTLTGSLDFCFRNKQLGGSDGFTFMGISVPVSNCSA